MATGRLRSAISPRSWAWNLATSLTATVSLSAAAEAQPVRAPRIDIAASSLPDAIAELSREAAVSIGTEGALPRLRVVSLHGRMTVGEALARLLAGSGYRARQVGTSAWRIERSPARVPPVAPARIAPPAELPREDPAPIVVTAAKRRLPLADLPMALSVVQIEGSRSFDPSRDTRGIAGEVEGLSLTALGSGRNRMFLRGISDSPFNGESQSTVAVLLDDARLTYSAPDPDIRLVDVERVEVLKGPQGSLYGTGALGGIYQIITRRADVDQTTFAGSVGVETVAHGRIGTLASGVANLPLFPDLAAVRLVGYSATEPGWVDTGPRDDSNADRVLGIRVGVGVSAGDGWRVDMTGFAQWLQSRDSNYVYQRGARNRPAQFAEPHDNDLRHIALRVARPSETADLVLSTGITAHEVGDTIDATMGADDFGLTAPRLLDDKRQYRVWDNEARLSGKAGSIDWLLGLSHVEARQTNTWLLSAAPSSPVLTLDDDRRTTTDSAGFGEVTLPAADRIKLTIGARLFRSNVRETRLLASGPFTNEQRRSGVTPSAALSWRPRPGRLIFLRYGSAFRQGGVDFGASGQVETLKSDELATIEAGWRESLPGGGQLDLGAYLSRWENLQSDLLTSGGLVETENAGNARILGAEMSLDMPLASGWRIKAGATITEAKLVSNTLGFRLDDRHLPVVPEYTLRGAIQRDLQVFQNPAFLSFQLRYLGPARLSFDPALDRPMGKVLESRLEARAAFLGFEAGLVVDNLFDRKADTFAFGNPLRFAAMRQFTPQRPRSASLSITRRF